MRAVSAIAGLDHGIIGVADLEAARARFQAMGFTITPRGRHIGWATANYCIMFPHDYVELLGVLDAAAYNAGLSDILAERGAGLLKLALRSDDADRTHEFLADSGLTSGPVQHLARELEMPDGTVRPEFRLVQPVAEAIPGLAGFICQHMTPELVWRPEWLWHRNTAVAAAAYTILATDPTGLAGGWARLFGPAAIAKGVDRISVETGSARLEFVTPSALPGLYPETEFPLCEPGAIVGLSVRVRDPEAVAAGLAEAGIDFAPRDSSGLIVAPSEACGVALAFEAGG